MMIYRPIFVKSSITMESSWRYLKGKSINFFGVFDATTSLPESECCRRRFDRLLNLAFAMTVKRCTNDVEIINEDNKKMLLVQIHIAYRAVPF